MKLTIDIESRSRVDPKKCGSWRYWEDPSSEVLCAAVKVDEASPKLWFPRWVWEIAEEAIRKAFPGGVLTDAQLFALIEQADTIEAHNMTGFELPAWLHVLGPRHGWPLVPFEKLRCSLAKCSYHSIPRSLDAACRFLKLLVQKDAEGYRLMLRLCRPRKATKNNPAEWHQEPADIIRLAQYCLRDVEAEHCLSQALDDLPPKELKIWQLDQKINHHGILIDRPVAQKMVNAIQGHEEKLLAEAKKIAGISPKQVAKAIEWCASKGVVLPDLSKETVKAARKANPPAEVDRFLAIRQSLGKSSTSKYTAMLERMNSDHRVRGAMLYHGAGTGRWAGQNGIQPQNLPRGNFSDTELCIDHIGANGFDDGLELLWGDPMNAASTCIRGMIIPPAGHKLFVSDFSSIEARVLAWLAGEEETLAAFRAGKDLYIVAATDIFGRSYEEIYAGVKAKDSRSKDQRQVGKACVLGLGYGGGIGAFATMAHVYGIDLETLPAFVLPGTEEKILNRAKLNALNYLKKHAGEMSFEAAQACDVIKQLWRRANPNVVALWKGCEDMVKQAIEEPGQAFVYGPVKAKVDRGFLRIKLPSGRCLHYYSPSLRQTKSKMLVEREGEIIEIEVIRSTPYYIPADAVWIPAAGRWSEMGTYGGKLVENIDQAIARDLLAEALLRLDAEGFTIPLHVHDEAVSEVPDGSSSIQEFDAIMAEVPEWATGCPIGADGFVANRYRK